MHVEDEVDGAVLVNQARQHEAGQEGFPGARLAENPVAALDKALQVDTDRGIHVEGLPNMKIAGIPFVPEDAVDVLFLGLADGREVNGDGLYQVRFTRSFTVQVVLLHHQ